MATAAAKKAAPQRRAINANLSTTTTGDSGDIVENTAPDKISLTSDGGADEELVTVVVPKAYTLNRDDGAVRRFEAGTQEMSVLDAAHWFSRAQGVKVYAPE